MTKTNQPPEWEERFDEKFGKSIPDEELSVGRGAGCDDCEINQRIRQEHKDFVREAILQREKEIAEGVQEILREAPTFSNKYEFLKKFYSLLNSTQEEGQNK